MADNPFESRLDRLFGEYANRGVHPFDRYAIAEATVASQPRARLVVSPLSRLGLVLVGFLLLAGVGVTLALGGRLPSLPALPGDKLPGLLVLAPDASTGTIRVFRPNGEVVAEVPGSTNGCDRLVVTPDGKRIAWVFEGTPVTIASLDGLGRISVPKGQTSRGYAFSPDRTRVAYLARNAGGTYALTIASLLDGSETVIARGLQGVQISPAAWSVAEVLALSVTTSAEVGVDVIDADGSHHRPLVRLPLGPGLSGIGWLMSWSPDGTLLAYARSHGLRDPSDAAVVDLATGRSTPITTADGQPVRAWTVVANSTLFRWGQDGRQVVVTTGDQHDALLDLATGESTPMPDFGFAPYWSPDGGHVALVRLSDPARLTVLTAGLSDPVDLVVDGPITGTAWSPDGRRIAVKVGTSIELLDPTGAEPPTRILTDVVVGYSCLSWWSVDQG